MQKANLEAHRLWRTPKFLVATIDIIEYAWERFRLVSRTRSLLTSREKALGGTPPKSILLVRLASIGDVIRSTALTRALRNRYPSARIDYLTSASTAGIFSGNSTIDTVYTVEEVQRLPNYDWVANLQVATLPDSFSGGQEYDKILADLDQVTQPRFAAGRYVLDGRVYPTHTTNHFYETELEELYQIALEPYGKEENERTYLPVGHAFETTGLPGAASSPRVGLFFGTSAGEGYDGGFRAFSPEYMESLCRSLREIGTVIVFGTTGAKSTREVEAYRELLKKQPDVIDLVDRPSLSDLFSLVSTFDVVVSNNPGPLHVSMALKVPTVGLYVNSADFKGTPVRQGNRHIMLQGFEPCNQWNWRWKHHCGACTERRYAAYGCNLKSFDPKLDLIPVERVRDAASRLIRRDLPVSATTSSQQNRTLL